MSYAYQWVDGEWKKYSNIQYKGTSPSQHEAWLDSLGEGEWGISYTQDTLWVHTYGSIAMPVSRDSIRFVRRYNRIAAGSHDAIIRDLDLRNSNYGLDVASSTNITVRNISTNNTFSGGIYLSLENTDCLVDSCDIDSVGNTALYNRTGSSCIFRYNSISNVLPLIDGIPTTGDQAGIGSQGSYTNGFDYSIGQHNTYEYNTLTNILNGAIDFYWNIGDTIRCNTGIDVGTGGSPHGTNIVFTGNDMSGRTGMGQGFNGSNIVNKGYGSIIYTNNVLRNVSDYGIRVSSNDSGGSVTISNNMVVMRSTGGNSFVNFITVNGITSTCNTFVGIGVFRAQGVTYSTLSSFYAATGLDSCSVWYSDTSGVKQDSVFNLVPPDYVLKQNYPNPFNSVTTIEFVMKEDHYAYLKVYDILGREIETLAQGMYGRGLHRLKWDSKNVASGIYYYKFTSGTYAGIRKMLLLR
jgi:hypothetical protein